MAKLIFEHTGEEHLVPDGEPITPVCEEAGMPFACTEGVCGTCAFEVVEGMENLSPCTPAEQDFFGEIHRERLACQCKLQHGIVKIKF